MKLRIQFGRILVAIAVTGLPSQSAASTHKPFTMAASSAAAVKCLGKPATIVGSARDDVIKGTPRRDVINARGGKDVVKSVGAGDKVCGGGGPDELKGGKGEDVLSGGKGEDTLNGGPGTDICKDTGTTYLSCEKPKLLLQVNTSGAAGTVTSDPVGINCGVDCTQRYGPGTQVELVAAPDGESIFAGWETSTGECDIAHPETCVVTMNSAASATAFFAPTYTLTVTKNGTGTGTVTSDVEGIDCGLDCTENHLGGSIVTLTADEDDGSAFTGWSGGGCSGTGTCEVTMDQATSVSATFVLTFTLTVTRIGSGTGTVTSTEEGIDCPPDCTESYPGGTLVMLNATPDGGSTFIGWSGEGCAGTGSCSVTMNQETSVTASFSST